MKKCSNGILKKNYLFIILILFQVGMLSAQIVINEEPKRLYYDFAIKRITKFSEMKNMRDVFHLNKYLMGKNRIMGNIFYNTGRVLIGDEKGTHGEIRQAVGFFTRIRFFEEFSFNTTFYIDFNKQATARWTSDYSYTIGRYNWKPRKWSYGYENYLNNKYKDNIDEFGKKFLEGYYFLSYSNSLPQKIMKAISFDASSNVKFVYFTRYAIKYRDEFNNRHGGLFEGKPSAGLGLRYTIFSNIYVEGAVYYYLNPKQRQPWDPDYTYGFGYFRWESFRVSLTYGNWAVNHFPGNKTPFPNYGFVDGQFKIIFNWIW